MGLSGSNGMKGDSRRLDLGRLLHSQRRIHCKHPVGADAEPRREPAVGPRPRADDWIYGWASTALDASASEVLRAEIRRFSNALFGRIFTILSATMLWM